MAVIGTGCSAIQVGPAIQPEVERLDIYQRSPGWTFPRMDFAYSDRAKRLFERFPVVQRLIGCRSSPSMSSAPLR